MPGPDDDEFQVKELLAAYGLALFRAHMVERQLAIALASVYGPGPGGITADQYDELVEAPFERTFGGLVSVFRRSVQPGDNLETAISEALQKRNWLVHRYFWERAITALSADGRETMIQELHDLADHFSELDSELTATTRQWGREHGVTDVVVQQTLEDLIREES